jgi:colicin import membrane protein
VDGDGIFTKDLYFLDVDGDGMRRIGLIDKYVAGCWDASLRSDDRPRPDVKKTASPAPVVVVPSSQPAVKPQAAPEPKPGDAKPDPAKPDPAKPDPAKPDPAKPGQIKPGPREPSKSKPPEEKSPDDDF